MKVYEVDFAKCAPGCDGWDADDGLGGCPLLPCKEIAEAGIVIIKNKGANLPSDEEVAQAFHEAYERLAPKFGYKTREASAKPWADVPENNKKLMVAVVHEIRWERRDGASPWG